MHNFYKINFSFILFIILIISFFLFFNYLKILLEDGEPAYQDIKEAKIQMKVYKTL